MAQETITVGTCVSRVSFMLTGNATADSALATEIKWALNSSLRDMVSMSDHPAFRKTATFNTVDGTQDYDAANDFYRFIHPSMKFTASPKWTLNWINQQEWDRMEGDQSNSSKQRPYHYTVRHRDATSGLYQIRFFPIPDAIYAMSYGYFSIPADQSAASDGTTVDPRFPAEFHRALFSGAATLFPQYLKPDQLVVYVKFFEEAKRAMRTKSSPVVGRQQKLKSYRPHMSGSSSNTYSLAGSGDYLDGGGSPV